MNAHLHAELSVKRRGGQISDYYAIHSSLDATKELCSDNRHRILHNLWGVIVEMREEADSFVVKSLLA